MTKSPRPFLAWPEKENLAFAATRIALICALFAVVYDGADYITAQRAQRFHLFFAGELSIPLWPSMIVVYDSIYVSFLLVPFVLRTRYAIERLAAATTVVIAIAGVCFLLFPAELGFPPSIVTGPFRTLFIISDKINLDYNLVPSLHVGLAFVCLQAFGAEARAWIRVALAAWAAAIAISTLLTHQHHLLDVIAGAALARLAFVAIYLRRQETCQTISEPSPATSIA